MACTRGGVLYVMDYLNHFIRVVTMKPLTTPTVPFEWFKPTPDSAAAGAIREKLESYIGGAIRGVVRHRPEPA